MAIIPGQGSLFTGGTGSNDPIIADTGASLGASERVRQEAASTVASSSSSPEARSNAESEIEKEIAANERLIAQTERKIKKQKAYEKAVERSERAIRLAQEKSARELRVLAKEAGAWEPDKGLIIIDSDGNKVTMMPDQYLDALRRGDKVAEDFQKQLAARLTRKEVSGMGMTGATGTNRPGFHIGDLVGAITTGNLGGIARELMQPLGGDRWQQVLKERGAMMTERAATSGGVRGLLGGLGGRAMAIAPMLATPAAILGAQQLVSRVTAGVQDTIREGQVTGGGFGEGVTARRETLQLAANPFDMLDRRTAQQIVSGIRGRGFTGELGRALQDTVGDVFQDLGTDIEETMTMVNQVVTENVMSLSDFRDIMRDLDDQAKETSLSVKTVQESLKSAMDLAGAAGGAPAAAAAALNQPALTSAFRDLTRLVGGQQAAQIQMGVLQRGAQMFGGVPAFLSGSTAVQQDAGRYFDRIAEFLWTLKTRLPAPYNTINGLAMYLAGPGQGLGLTGGMTDVAQIEAFLKALFKGRAEGGFQKKIATQRAEAAKSAASARLQAEKDFEVGSGYSTSALSGAIGIFNAVKHKLGFGGLDQDSMKSALQKLRIDMEKAGVEPNRINEILSKSRQAAFAKDLSTETRTDLWKPAWLETTREAEREIKVTLDMRPEASRYFQGINQPNQAWVAGGKNSQYVIRPPSLGR